MSAVERFHGFGASGGGSSGLPTDTKTLGADTGVLTTNTWTTILTSADLAVGTWLVTWTPNFIVGGANRRCAARVIAGTAVVSLVAPAAGYAMSGASGFPLPITMTALVTITTHGTLLMQAIDSDGANTVVKSAPSTGLQGGFPLITGYTAVKVA